MLFVNLEWHFLIQMDKNNKMIKSAVIDLYNISKIIILSITTKMKNSIDKHIHKFNSLSITKNYEKPN